MAEREGFEPSVALYGLHSLSTHAACKHERSLDHHKSLLICETDGALAVLCATPLGVTIS